MTDITTTIDRYFEAWNEADDARRAEIGRQVWADVGRYVDPLADTTGAEGFAAMVASVRSQFPGLSLRRASGIDVHHDVARFSWEAVAQDGSIPFAGIDVVTFDDGGRLLSVTGFIGDAAPVSA